MKIHIISPVKMSPHYSCNSIPFVLSHKMRPKPCKIGCKNWFTVYTVKTVGISVKHLQHSWLAVGRSTCVMDINTPRFAISTYQLSVNHLCPTRHNRDMAWWMFSFQAYTTIPVSPNQTTVTSPLACAVNAYGRCYFRSSCLTRRCGTPVECSAAVVCPVILSRALIGRWHLPSEHRYTGKDTAVFTRKERQKRKNKEREKEKKKKTQ